MRTMKDSGEIWIGAIPHDWSLGKLKYVAPEQRLVAQRNCRYIGLENIESGTGRLISYSNGEENNALVIKKRGCPIWKVASVSFQVSACKRRCFLFKRIRHYAAQED